MGVKGGPDIETDGLVFHLDAAAKTKSYPVDGLDVEYLVVAGGGGGGGVIGGGGGAGGLLNGFATAFVTTGTYPVVVGAGGAGGTGWNTSSQDGKVGGNSSALGITANGGGGGAHHGGNTTSTTIHGGSGGGGANGSYNGGNGISGQGNNGGNNGNGDLGSGGGGAGGVGGNAGNAFVVNSQGGAGGIGKYFGAKFGDVGHNGWFADGGGGGVRSYRGPYIPGVGRHGAGNGGFNSNDANINGNGSANTGSGGGGGGYNTGWSTRSAGNGGSGIVIIKYKGAQKATGGDSIITRKGFTIHIFTSSGNFVVGDRVGGTSRNKVVGELINMDSSNYKSGNRGYWNLATDEYIDCSSHLDDLIFSSPATISTWLMPLHNKNTGSAFFFLGNNIDPVSSGGGYAFILRYGSTTGGLTGETFVIYRYDGGGQNSQVTLYGISNGYEYQNQWVNATVVVDSNTWKLYVNGILQTLTRGSYWTGAQFKYGENISPKDRAFIGTSGANIRLADTKVYNIALTQQQILDNYNATKGRFGL